MEKKKRENPPRRTVSPSPRLDPEGRLCSRFDATGIRTYPLASWDKVGFQVLDDCCEDHIQ